MLGKKRNQIRFRNNVEAALLLYQNRRRFAIHSLGNVGQKRSSTGQSKSSYLDIVVTPVAGTGFLILEDIVDKYMLSQWIEPRMHNRVMIKIIRSLVTPTTSVANLLRWKSPWWRDTRAN